MRRASNGAGSGPTALRPSGPEAGGPRDRERALFDALRTPGEDHVSTDRLAEELRAAGIRTDDPRLAETTRGLEARVRAPARLLGYEEFANLVRPNVLLMEKAIKRDFVIPDFTGFGAQLEELYETAREDRGGEVADYIPQLSRVDPEKFGVALCTVDGQRITFGDAHDPFCVQSSTKPLLYALALEEHGEDVVHQHMGREPSGQSFNELALNANGRPHNPMINAGAIMSASLIRQDLSTADRFDHVFERWQALAGGARPGFSNPTYLSERRTADRNFALGYFMRENGAFPDGIDLVETLEFYFQCCSIEMTVDMMASVAATLANGGICPNTGRRIFSPSTVQKCLSLMYSCGMYDFSGEWAFTVGLPAKSGVSGVIMVVIPNVAGFCTWAPRLDSHGNSVRGIAFARAMVETFNFHNYDNLAGGLSGKTDPRTSDDRVQRDLLQDVIWAAAEGDVDGMRRLVVQGADIDAADYDGRTAIHLAASEGQVAVVEYLLAQGAVPAPLDRWGNTPWDDAERSGHEEVAALLRPQVMAVG